MIYNVTTNIRVISMTDELPTDEQIEVLRPLCEQNGRWELAQRIGAASRSKWGRRR
jgi:hypothetical protein